MQYIHVNMSDDTKQNPFNVRNIAIAKHKVLFIHDTKRIYFQNMVHIEKKRKFIVKPDAT